MLTWTDQPRPGGRLSAVAAGVALAAAAALALGACSAPPEGPDGLALGDATPGGGETPQPWGAASNGDDLDAKGPPGDEVGVSVLSEPLVFNGDGVVVAVTGLTVYSTGAQLDVVVRSTPKAANWGPPGDGPLALGQVGPSPDADGPTVSLKVVYPNGRTARPVPRQPGDVAASGPVLLTRGGGNDLTWHYRAWLHPLPQGGDGPLEVVVDWPDRGIDQARAALDADVIAAAGDQPVELWPLEANEPHIRAELADADPPETTGGGGRPAQPSQPVLADEPAPARVDNSPRLPPDTEIGIPIAFDPVVITGEQVAVAVNGLTAYRTGAVVDLNVHTHPQVARFGPGTKPRLQDVPTLGVAYPDGRVAPLVDPMEEDHGADDPGQPQLRPVRGKSYGTAWRAEAWLWPLPEPGTAPVKLVVKWPEQDIPPTRAELGVDAQAITAAAQRAITLWPPQPGDPTTGR